MRTSNLDVLVISHVNKGINRIFEDYCTGIRAHSRSYHYIDYIQEYPIAGKRKLEEEILARVVGQQIDCVFFIWWSCDLTFDIKFIERLSRLTTIVMNFF